MIDESLCWLSYILLPFGQTGVFGIVCSLELPEQPLLINSLTFEVGGGVKIAIKSRNSGGFGLLHNLYLQQHVFVFVWKFVPKKWTFYQYCNKLAGFSFMKFRLCLFSDSEVIRGPCPRERRGEVIIIDWHTSKVEGWVPDFKISKKLHVEVQRDQIL